MILRLYAFLLRLYPRRFRAEFEAEMQRVFAEAAAEAADQNLLSLAKVCLRELRDWPGAVLRAHLRERKKRMDTQSLEPAHEGKASWWAALAAVALFAAPAIYGLPAQGAFGAIRSVLAAAALLVTLVMLAAGVLKGFPRWSLPYMGLMLALVGFFGGAGLLQPLLEPSLGPWMNQLMRSVVTVGDEDSRLRWQVISSGILWLGFLFLLALVVALLATRRHSLVGRIRRDWTLLSFTVYGSALLTLFLAFDEYTHDGPYRIASILLMAAGAWAYLRSDRLWQRALALAAGIALAMAVVAVGKWTIVPLQNWPTWFGWHPPEVERRFESLRTLIDLGWILLVMAAPALPALWLRPAPPRPAA